MKKIILSAATLALMLASFSSCRKNESLTVDNKINDKESAILFKRFVQDNSPNEEKVTIDAAKGETVVLPSGTKIIFPPNVFANGVGATVTGNVSLAIQDILKPSSMILLNKPTLTVDGKMLESFGEIIVKASQNNNPVQLRPQQKPIMVQVPIGGNANGGNRDIPMWDGDTVIATTLNGHNQENEATSISQSFAVNKGVDWTQISGFGISTSGSTIFPLDALGDWRNCDALYNDPRPKTTILGYFGNLFNTETGNSYSGIDPSVLFFKTAGTNTIVKLYNQILNATSDKQGLMSYQNSIPIGQEGTFLAMSAKNGKFYAEMRDVTIPSPASGKNYVGYSFHLSEVSETQLLNLINQMNNK